MPDIDFATLAPYFAQAIQRQENDPTGMMGVRSQTGDPSQILMNSIMNNYDRWTSGKTPAPWIKERPKKFIDFMQKRWAPIGAENDPRNLNANWAPGVRKILKQMLGQDEYKKWQDMNLVMTNQGTSQWT
jgi:hypothetical protein